MFHPARRLAFFGWLLLAAAACGREPAPVATRGAPPPPRVALWVPCEGSERPLESASGRARLVALARELGATDLFVQVLRGGRAWFDSSIAERTPYERIREQGEPDPLGDLIARGRKAGIRIHAWLNLLSLAGRRDAELLKRLGPAAVQMDRFGRSLLDYPDLDVPPAERPFQRMGTRAVWLDPAVPEVAEALRGIVGELVRHYPGLAGVHFDYVRYPDVLPIPPGSRFGVGLDFGYGERSRMRFERETGLRAPFGGVVRNAEAWDDWRRQQVTALVASLARVARGGLGGGEVSAAVVAYADRAYLSLYQDWRGWLDRGLLDFAVAMAYTRDDRLLGYLSRELVGAGAGDRVWIGLGTWLFAGDPPHAARQLAIARAAAPAGLAFFSYDALAASEDLRDALRAGKGDER